jgi:hypothetical protein
VDAVPEHLAQARFHLATVIVETDRARALELARAALNGFPPATPTRDSVRAWLEAQEEEGT